MDDKILFFIKQNPGITSPELAQRIGTSLGSVSSRLTVLHNERKVTRRQFVGNGARKYEYFPVEAVHDSRAETVHMAPEVTVPAPPAPGSLDDVVKAMALTVATAVADSVGDIIAKAISEEVTRVVNARIADEVAKSLRDAKDHAEELSRKAIDESMPERARRRVLVVGVLPGHREQLTREFSSALALSFITGDDSIAVMTARAKGADAVFVTRFVSHSRTAALKSSGAKYVFIPGGVSAIVDALTAYYVEGEGEGEG